MHRVNLFRGPEKQVLRDISLSFFPGAKIGVLGPNGAGKSSLLKIMAGELEPSNGRAELAPGARVGMLPQEPQLDPSLDVRGNVELGVAEKRELLDRFAAHLGPVRRADDRRRDDRAAGGAGRGAGPDRPHRRLEPRPARSTWRWTRCGCPPGDAAVDNLSGGEKPPRGAVPPAAVHARPAAARRADQPPRRRVGGLAGAVPGAVRGHRLAVTHDRYFLDNVAGWILELDRGHGIPFQGNYSSWLEQKQARLAVEEKQESRPPPHAGARAGVGADGAPRPPRQVQGAPRRRTRSCSPRSRTSSSTRSRSTSPPARGWATWWSRPTRLARAFGDRLLFEDLSSRCRRAASSASSAPTAPARRRCSA